MRAITVIKKKNLKELSTWLSMKKEKEFYNLFNLCYQLKNETFIKIINFQVINDNFIIFLNDDQVENIECSTNSINIIKKIELFE